MTNSIDVNMISGRTVWQGVAIEGHKHDDGYIKACGIVEMDVSDMKASPCVPRADCKGQVGLR